MGCTLEPAIQSCDSCQLAITSMDVHKDIHYQVKHRLYKIMEKLCLGHLASNARSLQENNVRLVANQSTHTIVGIK